MLRYKIDIIAELAKHGVTYYSCRKPGSPVSQGTFKRFKNGEPVSLSVLDRVCQILKCQLSDIIEIVPDSDKE